jgi:hypothetical protein
MVISRFECIAAPLGDEATRPKKLQQVHLTRRQAFGSNIGV